MNTDLLRPELTGSGAVEDFARYYLSPYDLDALYPDVQKCILAKCPLVSRLAIDLYDELIYSELSTIDFLDFLDDFMGKRYKVGLLAENGIDAIDDDDDDELFILLNSLGEEKVLVTLCTEEFMSGHFCF